MNPVPYVPETGAGKMESIYGAGFTGIQGGPKKVSQIILAITLSTASQFP